jgi:hypothetical protein
VRYCSAAEIEPEKVNEEVLDRYMHYRRETTRLAANQAARRRIARSWNASMEEIKGWPRQRLIEPPPKSRTKTAWESFPQGLRGRLGSTTLPIRVARTGISGAPDFGRFFSSANQSKAVRTFALWLASVFEFAPKRAA